VLLSQLDTHDMVKMGPRQTKTVLFDWPGQKRTKKCRKATIGGLSARRKAEIINVVVGLGVGPEMFNGDVPTP